MESARGGYWQERVMDPGEVELLAAFGGAAGQNSGGAAGEALGAISPGDGLEGGDGHGPLGGLQETYLPPQFHATRRRSDEPRE